jgi:hypothetical protein
METLKVCRLIIEDLLHGVEFSHSHLILSKGTSLVSTDLVGTAHCLRGGELTHPIVLSLHLHDRECKRDCDCKGKTFRDGDNDNCHSSDQGEQEIINGLSVPCFWIGSQSSIEDSSSKTEH